MSLREKWNSGEETLGGWLSVASTTSAEAVARLPLGYVCVDNQHGVNDYLTTAAMIQAIELAGNTPIVRVPWNEPGIIGKMLDAGAQGVIVPMVNSVAEAEAAVRAMRYPPAGARSFGPVLAAARHESYLGWCDEHLAAIPMIETVQAVEAIDDILSVPGIDAVYVGPADLSLSLGLPPGNNDGVPLFDDALETIVAACRRHGVVPGIHSTGSLTPRRRGQGFRMITVTSDLLALRIGHESELAAAARGSGDAGDGDGRMY